MNKITLRLTRLFVSIDDLCKGKRVEKRKGEDGKVGYAWVKFWLLFFEFCVEIILLMRNSK
jgi:hypothetical protein